MALVKGSGWRKPRFYLPQLGKDGPEHEHKGRIYRYGGVEPIQRIDQRRLGNLRLVASIGSHTMELGQ